MISVELIGDCEVQCVLVLIILGSKMWISSIISVVSKLCQKKRISY